jgi:hypothetical protein
MCETTDVPSIKASMTFYTWRGFNLVLYPWHSINLIPRFSVHQNFTEHPGSYIEAILFGRIIGITVPFKLPCFDRPPMGWLYSRRRKKWYRASEIKYPIQ